MHKPTEHLPTSEARASLAARFGLVYMDGMQDWEWEVAEPTRFNEFLLGYASQPLSVAERFSLMELLLQCVEESAPPELFAARWEQLEPHLVANMALHRQTVEYWSCKAAAGPEEQFRITGLVRRAAALASASE